MRETKDQLARQLIQEVIDNAMIKQYEQALKDIYDNTSCQIAQSIALEALGDKADE